MKMMRVFLVVVVALVSFCAKAQTSEINKLINKYKELPGVLYSEKRNPQTGEVIKKEIIVSVQRQKEVKELFSAVDKLAKDGKGITDLTKNDNMIEVKSVSDTKRYTVMVSGKRDGERASLMYEEKPINGTVSNKNVREKK